MKNILLFSIALTILSPLARADNFTTLDGDTYTNATVKRVEPDGIVIADTDGVRKLKFKNLAPEIGVKYGYDPTKAAAFQATLQANAAAGQAAAAQENQKVANQRAAADKQISAARAKIPEITTISPSTNALGGPHDTMTPEEEAAQKTKLKLWSAMGGHGNVQTPSGSH
jgi:hypothetical protein